MIMDVVVAQEESAVAPKDGLVIAMDTIMFKTLQYVSLFIKVLRIFEIYISIGKSYFI